MGPKNERFTDSWRLKEVRSAQTLYSGANDTPETHPILKSAEKDTTEACSERGKNLSVLHRHCEAHTLLAVFSSIPMK